MYFQMSIEAKKVKQLWVGDSHLLPHHFVPTAYQKLIEKFPVDGARFSETPDLSGLRGGRQATFGWFDQLCRLVSTQGSLPFCLVICIGSNNLRKARHPDTLADLEEMMLQLVTTVNKTSNGTMVVVSPIPDDHGNTDSIGEELDQRWHRVVVNHAESGRVRYAQFRRKCLPHNHGPTRFASHLFQDDVHLNSKDAKLLAKTIFRTQTQFSNRIFGFTNNKIGKREKSKSTQIANTGVDPTSDRNNN